MAALLFVLVVLFLMIAAAAVVERAVPDRVADKLLHKLGIDTE